MLANGGNGHADSADDWRRERSFGSPDRVSDPSRDAPDPLRDAPDPLRDATETAGDTVERVRDATASASGSGWSSVQARASAVGESVSNVRDRLGAVTGRTTDSAREMAHAGYDAASNTYARLADHTARTTDALADGASAAGRNAAAAARNAVGASRGFIEFCTEQPLVLLGLGLALGGTLGALFPLTETENRLVGKSSGQMKSAVREAAGDLYEKSTAIGERALEAAEDEAEKQGVVPATRDPEQPVDRGSPRADQAEGGAAGDGHAGGGRIGDGQTGNGQTGDWRTSDGQSGEGQVTGRAEDERNDQVEAHVAQGQARSSRAANPEVASEGASSDYVGTVEQPDEVTYLTPASPHQIEREPTPHRDDVRDA
jgi:hypothetical protein